MSFKGQDDTLNDKNSSLSAVEKEQLLISERRRKVASLLAQSRTEAEIAKSLGVNQSTVSRDVQAIKEESNGFLQDLAKTDLVFSFQQSIRGIDEVKRRLWDKVNSDEDPKFTTRDKLAAFRLIMIAEETKYRLLEKGPLLLSHASLVEKIKKLEQASDVMEDDGGLP